MKKYMWIFLYALLLASPAQADTLTAKLNRNPVPVGETFVLTLEYSGDPKNNRPDFSLLEKDFTVYMVSNSYKGTYRNGKMDKTYIWSVTMAAEQIGSYTIPSLSVNNVQSRPLVLNVVDASNVPTTVDNQRLTPKFTVARNIDNPHPFVQQQINYSFTITTDAALQGTAPQFLADNADDWIIRVLGDPVISTKIQDGVEMREITFNYALFPQKSGSLVIPEVRFSGYYVAADNRYNSSLQGLLGAFSGLNDAGFGLEMFGRRVPVNLKARPISIEVEKIPVTNQGRWWLPAKDVKLTSNWQQKIPEFKSGEAVSREIYLQASGVIDTQLPEIQFPEISGMKQYPEKPVVESKIQDGDVISFMKMKNVYIPEKSGLITLPEIVVYWYNVQLNKIEKAVLPEVKINVLPGKIVNVNIPDENLSQTVKDATLEQKNNSSVSATAVKKTDYMIWYLLAAFAGGIIVSLLAAYFLGYHHASPKKQLDNKKTNPASSSVSVGKAIRNNDLRAIRDNVIEWAEKIFSDHEIHNLNDVASLVEDEVFTDQLKKLQAVLYSKRHANFDAGAFMQVFSRISKKQKQKQKEKKKEKLLPDLYKKM